MTSERIKVEQQGILKDGKTRDGQYLIPEAAKIFWISEIALQLAIIAERLDRLPARDVKSFAQEVNPIGEKP